MFSGGNLEIGSFRKTSIAKDLNAQTLERVRFAFCGKGSKLLAVKPMKYTVVLEREADGGYVATAPVLPGCFSQGDDRQEALANIREAIELYVEDCRLAGDPVPEEDSVEYVELLTGTFG